MDDIFYAYDLTDDDNSYNSINLGTTYVKFSLQVQL